MRLLLLLPVVSALNILLSSTDSWVSSNVRYLYPALRAAGHDVVYIGPLNFLDPEAYESDFQRYEDGFQENQAADIIADGQAHKRLTQNSAGAFDHLAEANQEYFKNIRKRNIVPRGAKNSLAKKDLQDFDQQYASQKEKLVKNRVYGQDPLNSDFWYVDANPLVALAAAFDHILPQYYDGFTPDLVLVGPNAGLHLTPDDLLHSSGFKAEDLMALADCAHVMRLLAQFHNFPVVSVSVEDEEHVYFEDEDIFNVEEEYSKSFRRNIVSKNIEFVNQRVVALVESVASRLTPNLALNVNFPSINRRLSKCFTKGSLGPDFVQVVRHKLAESTLLGKVYSVPQFAISKDKLNYIGSMHWKTSDAMAGAREILEVEVLRLLPLFEESLADAKFPGEADQELGNLPEARALDHCEIAVSVCDITQGNNLAAPALYLK